ncbi:hypothetical protein PRZ48_011398 [Zasmidium cellare]|uniref:Uncharacterized protein n=1 Tax=Zasmidium cellare TaxID=395010 RepID=A0ABR0E6K2_ZASCE|nr:hypothetical protein PRZ48_011398 [Zasmidium cellare]
MIEEKNLKKGFIVATLISTIVGTFTASMTLHDKYQEKKAKKAQKQTDGKQNNEIKELKEQIEKLSGGGDGAKKNDDKPKEENKEKEKGDDQDKKSQRSRSRSRSSSRHRRRRDSMDRSRAMIEQTYANHLMRVGDRYAEGDLVTENKLQAQVIQLQKTVIDVLQDAVHTGRGLTDADMDKIIAAQNAARDGSLGALNGQYQRMITEKEPPAPKPWEELPPPSRRASQASQRPLEPVYAPSRRASTIPQDYPDSRRASVYQAAAIAPLAVAREPSAKAINPPGPSRKDSVQSDYFRSRAVDQDNRSRKAGSDPPRGAEPDPRPRKAGSDPPRQNNDRPKSLAARPEPAPPPNDKKAPSVNPAEKNEKRPTDSQSKAPAPQESKIVHPSSISSPPSGSRASQTKEKGPLIKALPPAGNHTPFCRYALDLQTTPLPLHHNFRSSGSQRCPACGITIPVNNRDVWVFSLQSPTPGKPPRDYRMDARFVAKCHASDGSFACLLCERYRTMDCFCKSVDALVKHLGSAHTAEEFERDGDLVRMRRGSGVNVGGREMVLA